MGLFGEERARYRKLQQEKHSPQKPEERTVAKVFHRSHSVGAASRPQIKFEFCADPRSPVSELLMDQSAFERGPTLFADQRNESFAQLERETTAAKRQKNEVEEKENSGANKLQYSPL